MTREERHLWYDFLVNLPITIRKQMVIGNYIVDFCIPKYRIVIELDGKQHDTPENQNSDYIRDSFLTQQGYAVLRYPNSLVNQNFHFVCEDILAHIRSASANPNKFF